MNLGVQYLRKNELQKALTYYEKAKISLEEGYEKFTEFRDEKRVTKALVALVEEAISVLTGTNQENVESLIAHVRGHQEKQQEEKFNDEFDIPHLPLKKRKKSSIRCKRAIQNYIRIKYHGNPNKFKKDFPSNYEDSVKKFENDQKSIIPGPKDADFFSFVDTGVFPYIIKTKMKEWNLIFDTVNVIDILYFLTINRHKTSHDSGENDGELDDTSANARYWNEQMIIRFFEAKINE